MHPLSYLAYCHVECLCFSRQRGAEKEEQARTNLHVTPEPQATWMAASSAVLGGGDLQQT